MTAGTRAALSNAWAAMIGAGAAPAGALTATQITDTTGGVTNTLLPSHSADGAIRSDRDRRTA